MGWMTSVWPPDAGSSSRLARRVTSVNRWPASDVTGGSIVLMVAKCATGTDSIGSAVSRSRCARANASISGSSGMSVRYAECP